MTRMQVDFPYTVDGSGRTGRSRSYEQHIRALIAQVLFTDPGERVNLPTFGSGIRQMVFEGGNSETFAAAQFLVQASLEEWLGDLIDIEAVETTVDQTTLIITIQYTIRRTEERQTTRFTG